MILDHLAKAVCAGLLHCKVPFVRLQLLLKLLMWEHVFFFVHTYIFINFFALYRQSLLKGRHCQSGQIFINSFSWRASTPSTNTAKKEPKISNAREQRPLPSICVKYTNPGSLLSTPVSYRHPCSKRKIRQKISHLPASGLCPAWVFSFLNIVHFFFFLFSQLGVRQSCSRVHTPKAL